MNIAFELAGQAFIALNGGPQFTFTPAISLFVACGDDRSHRRSECQEPFSTNCHFACAVLQVSSAGPQRFSVRIMQHKFVGVQKAG